MKKLLSILLVVFMPLGALSTHAQSDPLQEILELLDRELAQREAQQYDKASELSDAVTTIHELGITKFDEPVSYMATNAIRRDEAAAMFYRFAVATDLRGPALDLDGDACDFPDLEQGHSDLVNVMRDSCRYGLFKGAEGRFLPTKSITNAEAVTVLARILDGFKDETGNHRADQYHDYLRTQGYLTRLSAASTANYDDGISRGDIAIILARAYESVQ